MTFNRTERFSGQPDTSGCPRSIRKFLQNGWHNGGAINYLDISDSSRENSEKLGGFYSRFGIVFEGLKKMEHNADSLKVSDDPFWGLPCTCKRIEKVPQVRRPTKWRMRVVNVSEGNLKRKGYRDLAHWLEDENHVYVGRSLSKFAPNYTPKPGSDPDKWGNPYSLEEYSREECCKKYEAYARRELVDQLHELSGKELGCWCHPLQCHGDVLMKLHKEYVGNS